VRARIGAVCGAALVAAGVTLACAGCAPARPTARGCLLFGMRAIEQHVTVRSVPAACAGLTHLQLNEIVSSAVREAAGPHPKAIERRIAAADARYLAGLVQGVALPPASAANSPSGPQPSGGDLRLIALGCWAATVTAGGYLFAGHRGRGRTPAMAIGHAAVGLTGLAVWAAFAVARVQALAWTAAALIIAAAGLGMAVLVMSIPEPPAPGPGDPVSSGSGPAPRRVLATACHVTLAVSTVLLVLLAATGSGHRLIF
jgi:hypothetical protein